MEKLYFGEFWVEVDEARCHGVFRGDEPVALSDVPRKVLFVLLKQRPRPVIAKELLGELWRPDANPSNVAKQVKALRRALDDDDAQRYIRTLNKEGYAFVMPVAEKPPRSSSAKALQRRATKRLPEPANAAAETISGTEWRLATEKLLKDFRGSCLHDHELLAEALEECDRRIQLTAEQRSLKLEGRFPHEPLFVPPRSAWASSTAADPEVAARAAELLRFSRTAPLVIDVGSYSAACLAVLQSLRRRYGLETRTDFEGLTGRQQVLRLYHSDAADFLFAPHVPVLLVGDYGALDYRRISPVHSYEQVLLRRAGLVRTKKRRLLIYKGGYPEEQMLTGVSMPNSAEPEMVGSLERLIENVQELAPGDMVIAWQPLASGLESRSAFVRLAEYRCWVSMFCHKRWHRGALRNLKDQFRQLFASEWAYCRWNHAWAIECLAMEPTALASFAAGSGLGPGPGTPHA